MHKKHSTIVVVEPVVTTVYTVDPDDSNLAVESLPKSDKLELRHN